MDHNSGRYNPCKNEREEGYGIPMLPRFGIRLFLDKEFDNAEYYGIGPDESYVDKKRSGYHGKHCAEIHEMHEDYRVHRKTEAIQTVII